MIDIKPSRNRDLMLTPQDIKSIIDLVKREVLPAIGCTEPIAAALCTAKATEILGFEPEHISLSASANILKNAMGVGIPGTGMIGLPIAVALGALIRQPELQLRVLKDVTPELVARGREMIANECISISLAEGEVDKLYIDVTVSGRGHSARAVISGGHTNFVLLEHDGNPIPVSTGCPDVAGCTSGAADPELTLERVWDFATGAPLHDIRFILDSARINKSAAEFALAGEYGHSVGRTLHCPRQRDIMGDSIFSRILSYTSAACDARMGGAQIPVMSNSGSGNQGISATIPVVIYAEETKATSEQTIRALMLSHLTVIYIKQSLGRLSALCGCVVAATGSSCGITYLMGGNFQQIVAAVKNMIANLTGMICDGAKPGCAIKVASGTATAIISAMMAMEGHRVSSDEGIIDDNVDRCIRNLTDIGSRGMNETDRLVLEIMTHKSH